MNKYFSQLIDNLYQEVSHKKTCSLLFEKEEFDGKVYSNESFYEYTKQYFNSPQKFYLKSENPDYIFSLKKVSDTNQFSQFSFDSPYSTRFEENKKSYFKLFNASNSDVLLIFSPGWARPNLNVEIDFCVKMMNSGINCLLPTIPFHQERTPKGFYSGELFISANQLFTVANFRQYVAELRNIVSYYRDKYDKIGFVGMSSGGFQAGLLTTVEEVDFYFPFITGAELSTITWNGTLTKYVKKDLINKNITEKELGIIWAIADQKYLGQNCKARYIKQYISKYDEVVPTPNQFALNNIYNNPPTFLINSAHTSVFFSLNKIIKDMTKELKALPKIHSTNISDANCGARH
ncbi:MAG: alpha/beta hydrolase family protein [bacterium]